MMEESYEILDGVRRAKAAFLCGRETIEARMHGVGPIVTVSLALLWSTKERIETFGVRGADWDKIFRATEQGRTLPPIEITPGQRGVPLSEVEVEEGLDAFRNSL